MKSFYAYIRVSTARQGEHGVSLSEQRDAIAAFAARNDITITEWFEERETAAKLGRREFNRMLGLLKKRKADGVVFHKIDRGARNLKDWSVIQDLTELGIEVRFAHEPIDLSSSAGQLTGDFMAVIATHYIRNLREEVKKGLRGRLKQGLYPFKAPLGYLDQGGGKPKVPDPERASLVRQAFELCATGRYSLRRLSEELNVRGLRTQSGKPISITQLHKLLHNPFYAGLIVQGGETYIGIHEPLISVGLFQDVERVLSGKISTKVITHDFRFRRLVTCICKRSLIGERQKGHVYYRCHTRDCPTRGVREEVVDQAVRDAFTPFSFTDQEITDMRGMYREMAGDQKREQETSRQATELQLANLRGRMDRLVDAFVDGALEKELFESKKRALLLEQRKLNERLHGTESRENREKRWSDLELLFSLRLSYETGTSCEKRELVQMVTSNLTADRKYVGVALHSPYQEAAHALGVSEGEPYRNRPRTGKARKEQLRRVVEIIAGHDSSAFEPSHDGAFGQSGDKSN